MYETFYGFTRPPFANIPDPEFLYPSPEHRKALAILQYALMARAGFCVITGDIGAGKTTLVRKVLQTLDQRVHVGLVSNTQCETFEELLRWILLAFELDYRNKDKVQMYDEFVQFLIRQHRAGTPVTLIIDEAQNLTMENLEQLRMLSNVNTEKGQLLQTILVGQPELWTLLRNTRLEQFVQRISYDYFLKPLADVETIRGYIQHRLATAGGSVELFTEEAYPLIAQATRGVPRLINLLCDTALVYGYGDEEPRITVEIVRKVIADKQASFTPVRIEADDVPATRGAAEQESSPLRAGATRHSTIERAAMLRTRQDP
jgi:type II secretory pathway predicted ATPase ExeA